jgi:hypothetical protein
MARPEREIVREFELDLPLADCERWLRSPESRMCFPGAHEVHREGKGLILMYRVELSAPGTRRPADLEVEEHLTPPAREGEGLNFNSVQTWRWPSGALASAFADYELTPESATRTRVRLTQRYVLPGSVMLELLDDFRFRKSTERAFDAYVASLRDRAPAPTGTRRAARAT